MTTATTIPTMRTAAGAPTAFGYAPPPPTDPETATRNLEAARRYLAAIEGGATGAALAAFYTPDVEQVEYPNRLLPMGATRDLAALLDGAVRGQQVVRAQRYEVRAAHASGDHVVLELLWVATLARSIGMLLPGHEMRAHFAVVLEYRDGRIARQRNYDCFEPF
ncbi:nuclear transport factor 2 family protein [Roseisolibacter agri]|uniref:SnoaL-like domain-containing protein n=1 Tax=Roseisolibacter agri TaxID=2014610 RepID=A0AA37Q4Y7_9BACT|nr:nuclear transport factor 2 family protein [Roseisolibacter agri]GLC24697.1 hypothetical protein rosag_12100 [Roseisolibacter agri]